MKYIRIISLLKDVQRAVTTRADESLGVEHQAFDAEIGGRGGRVGSGGDTQ